MFDQWADDYEIFIRGRIPRYDELQKVFFNLLHFRREEEIKVLDLGVGTGENAETLLRRFPNVGLVGIDVSRKMLQRAREKLVDFAQRAELIRSDFRALPLTCMFSFVYSVLAVHHLSAEDKRILLKSVWSMLKPGGCFVLIDVVTGSTEELTNRYVSLTFPFDPEDSPSSLREHLQWLEEAGFERVDVPWKYYKLAVMIAFKRD